MEKLLLIKCFVVLFMLSIVSGVYSQTAIDTIAFGNSTSEAAHSLTDTLSSTYSGMFGSPARTFLPQTTPYYYGGSATFTMQVDPVNQNYFTVKFSGSDFNAAMANGRIILDCNGYEVGTRHGNLAFTNNDWDVFLDNTAQPFAVGSFWYRTVPLPISLTQGHTSVTIGLRSTGWFFPYGTPFIYNTYQRTLTSNTNGIYKAYTHTNPYVPLPASDVKGLFPSYSTAPIRNTTGAAAITTLEGYCNSQLTNILNGTNYILPYDDNSYNLAEFLAQSYFIPWTVGYNNPAVVQKVIAAIDSNCANYIRDTTLVGGCWGGAYGRFGYAAALLYSQISSQMSASVNFGNGVQTRAQYWTTMFLASYNNGRENRRSITNQDIYGTWSMYGANMILQLIAPSQSVPTSKALNYIHQAMGLAEWTGSESASGVPNYSYGRGYYMMSTKGASHEPGWVSEDCYGNLGEQFYEIFKMTGDSAILNRGVQHEKIYSYFRYPATDANGFRTFLAESPICDRNENVGTTFYNDGIWLPVASQDPTLLGMVQQSMNDGQFFYNMLVSAGTAPVVSSWLFFPSMYSQFLTSPSSSIVNPSTPGQPNYTVSDEQNGIIAIKYNKEQFFAMFFRKGFAINNLAKIHHVTPYTERVVEVQEQDVRYTPSGTYLTSPSSPEDYTTGTPPDNPVSAYSGVLEPYPIGPSGTVGVGFSSTTMANFYSLNYGSYFIGMNTTSTQSYTLNVPSKYIGTTAVNLFTGATVTLPDSIVVSPSSTCAYYLDSTIAIPADTCKTPSPKKYYSQGSLDITSLSSWNTSSTGGGTSPTTFSTSDTFYIQSGHSMFTGSTWSDGLSGAVLNIGNGGTLTATYLVSVTNFIVQNGGTYVHNVADTSAFPSNGITTMIPGSIYQNFGSSSTVVIEKWANGGTSPVPLPNIAYGWGNLTINVASLNGSWIQTGTTLINGNLTITATGGGVNEFKLVSTGAINDTVRGNFYMQGGRFAVTQVSTTSYGYPYSLVVSNNFQQTGGYFTIVQSAANPDLGTLTVGGNMTISSGYFLESGFYSNGNYSATTIANASTISGITSGMGVAGAGIANGVTVNGAPSGTTITITSNASGGDNGMGMPLFAGTTFTGTTTSGSNSITSVSSTSGLTTGMNIGGANIPTGCTITGISGSTITISQLAYANGSTTLVPGTVTFTGDIYAYGGNAQSNVNCIGNFLLNGGTYGFGINTNNIRSFGMQVGGNFTVSSGTFVNPGGWGTGGGGVSVLFYNGSSATSTFTLPNTSTANSNLLWTVASGKTINLGSNIGLGKYFAVAGTLNMGNYSFTGGTLNVLSTNGFTFTGTLGINNPGSITSFSAANNLVIGMPVSFSTAGVLLPNNTIITQITSTSFGIAPAALVNSSTYTGTFTVAPFSGTVTTTTTGTFPGTFGASTRVLCTGSSYGLTSSSAQTIGSFNTQNTEAYATVTSGSTTVTLNAANSNIVVGQGISGTGIPSNATVSAYDGNVTVTLSANATATNTNVYVVFNDAVASINSLTMSGGKTVTLSTSLKVMDTTTLTASSDILNLNGNTLTLGNTGINNTIRGSGFLEGSTSSSLSLLGTGITGSIGLTSNTNLSNLTVNLTGGGTATLGSNVTTNGTLTLTNGTITTSTYDLIMATGATVSRTSGWVNGYFRKNVATGTSVARTFEIGDATNYTPVNLTFASVTTAGDLLVSSTPNATIEAHYSSYPLSKTKYINRYWTLTNANTLAFTNYNATYNFTSNDSISGTNTSSLLGSIYSSSWSTAATATAGSESATLNTQTTLGDVILAECVGPNLFTVTGGGTSCTSGTAFSVGLSSSQAGVNYQLKDNGSNVGGTVSGTGSVLSLGSETSAGTYTVTGTSGTCTTSMTGNVVILYPTSVTPSVSVAASPSTAVCSGTSVTFTATPTNGGTAPTYQWTKNGSNVGTGGTTYTNSALNNGDAIVCTMTANNTCQTSATATSSTVTASILANTSSTTNASVFYGTGYTFNGTTYYQAGTYSVQLTNAAGCDSTATLVLSIIPQTYTWIGGTSGSFATSTNWSPTRTSPSTSDTLLFDGNNINGSGGTGAITVSSLSTQTIAKLYFQNSPTVTFSTNSATLTINVDLLINGTISLVGNTFACVGNVDNNSGTLNGGGTLEMTGSGSLLNVNGTGVSLQINTSGTVYLGSNSTVAGIVFTSGTFNDNGAMLTNTGNISGSGTHTSTGVGEIKMTGAGTSITASSSGSIYLGNVEIATGSASNVVTTGSNPFTIKNNLTITSGTFSLGGTIYYGSGGTTAFPSNLTTASGAVCNTVSNGTEILDCQGVVIITNSGTLGQASYASNTGLQILTRGATSVTINGTGTCNLDAIAMDITTTSTAITIGQTMTLSSTGTALSLESIESGVAGNTRSLTINAGTTVTVKSGSFGANYTTTANGLVPETYNINGTLDASGGKVGMVTTTNSTASTIGTLTSITLNIGATGVLKCGSTVNVYNLQPSTQTITVSVATGGTISYSGISYTTALGTGNSLLTTSNSNLTFTNSSTTTLTLASAVTVGNNLTLNAATTLSNSAGLTVNGTLSLGGLLTLGSNNFTMGSSATIANASATKYIYTGSSNLIWNGIASTATTFPIGTSASYTPLTVTNTSGTSNITVGVQSSITNAVLTPTKVVNLQWSVTGSAATTATITYQFNSSNGASSFVATNACELGTYNSGYTVNYLGIPTSLGGSAYSLSESSIGLGSGVNYLFVIGNLSSISCIEGTYIGASGGNANLGSNWCGGIVPSSATNVVIASNTPILNSNLSVNNLSLSSGINLNGYDLTINGAVTGTGTITGSSISNISMLGTGTLYFDQTTPGTTNVLDSLTINSSGTVTLGNALNLLGTLTSTAGTLSTGGNLTLVSNSSGTARIGQVLGTISGNVTAQRYITAKTARKYSFVGSTVAQSIRSAWQQQVYITGSGTGGQICGTTTGDGSTTDMYNSNGFDKTITNISSMFTYNATKVNGSRYVSIANTDHTNLAPGTGYCINIRGNRNSSDVTCANQLNTYNPTAPEAVTLSATGTVTTGNLSVSLNNPSVHPYTLLANPYPSQISFSALQAANSIINNKMWTFSPFGNGNFTTYSNGVIANGATGYDNTHGNYIASGQAFFVEANTSGSVTFQESHKTSGTIPNTQYFGTVNEKLIRLGLYSTGNELLDEIVIRYNNQGTAAYNASWDAASFGGGNQTLASLKGDTTLAIASRPISTYQDTVPLKLYSSSTDSFQFKFTDLTGFDTLGIVVLKDNFLNVSQDISSNPVYDFTVTSDTNSSGNKRFQLVVTEPSALPITFTSISATQNSDGVGIQWKVSYEINIASYQVERSVDGIHYYTIAKAKAVGTSIYAAEDNNIPTTATTLYYRIKSIGNDGSYKYSSIAKLTITDSRFTTLSIAPNPVQETLNLVFGNQLSGKVDLSIVTADGKTIIKKEGAAVSNGSVDMDVSNLASGVYLIQIVIPNGDKLTQKFMKE